MKEKLFRVNEWHNGFDVEHIPTGTTHWMSDGVDVLECAKTQIVNQIGDDRTDYIPLDVLLVNGKVIIRVPDGDYYAGPLSVSFCTILGNWLQDPGDDEQMMSPGDPDFRETWEEVLNECSDTLEAYFPEEYAKE